MLIQQTAAASERDQLLQSRNPDLEAQMQDQRGRLLQGTERLEESSRRLDDAHRMALETTQLGIDTLSDLHRQRQQIERTRDGVNEIHDSWDKRILGLQKVKAY